MKLSLIQLNCSPEGGGGIIKRIVTNDEYYTITINISLIIISVVFKTKTGSLFVVLASSDFYINCNFTKHSSSYFGRTRMTIIKREAA
ncbi:hypothetical protein NIES4073_72670 [Kalymmatonema gypsitolerans NIES-4073]|nr:hypothetical protein NIES4073_72670 [Scytonema sp. NIES-4073]